MPRKPADTIALQVRMTEALRRKLASAAEKNARSLNSEIVWRLGQTFGTEGNVLVSQHEANEIERARVLKEIVHSPEFREELVERLAESQVFKDAIREQEQGQIRRRRLGGGE